MTFLSFLVHSDMQAFTTQRIRISKKKKTQNRIINYLVVCLFKTPSYSFIHTLTHSLTHYHTQCFMKYAICKKKIPRITSNKMSLYSEEINKLIVLISLSVQESNSNTLDMMKYN